MTSPVRRRRDKRLKQLKTQAVVDQQQASRPAVSLHDWQNMNQPDCWLVARAIRQDWPVPMSIRPLILDGLFTALDAGSDRLSIAVAKTCLTMAESDQRARHRADEKPP